MSFTINATTARELSQGIRDLAAIIGEAAELSDMQGAASGRSGAMSVPVAPQSSSSAVSQPAQLQPITKEEVRAKLATLMQNGKDVQPLLESFGAKRLSDIPPEHYPALMQKAGELE